MSNKFETVARLEKLQGKIMECVKTIRECEDEIVSMGHDDLYDSGFNTREILWRNLRRIQSGYGSEIGSLGRYDEVPCFAIVALLEQKLLPKPESGLLLRGCSILVQEKCGQFCITGDVDESIADKIRVYC